MNRILKIVSVSVFLVFLSCEDVVEIEIPQEEIRLVINGVLRVDESKEFLPVEIKVTETSAFFEENRVAQIENAVILYGTLDERAPEFSTLAASNLAEKEPGTGIYIPDPSFSSDQRIRTAFLEPDMQFFFFAEYKGRNYGASTTYKKSVPFDNLGQGEETLFNEDEIELVISITDSEEPNQFYVLDFNNGEFLTLSDEFFNGQEFEFSYFLEEEAAAGDQIEISLLGSDQEFYNYTNKLLEQSDTDFNLFQTPATTIRGNVFDVTGLDNIFIVDNVDRPLEFALGYFAVVEQFKDSLIIE